MYGLQMARHLGIPLVVTFHGFDCTSSKEALLRSGVWSNIRFALFEDCLKRNADCFIAVSDFIKRCLVERGYPEDRIVRHYIGVDTDIFRPLPDKAESTPYVLCVARHTEKKGIDNLLRAFSLVSGKHAEVRLLLVGGGPLTDELKSLAADLSVSHRVDFMGPKPPGEVRRLMQEATVFALCGRVANSGDAEGLGIVFNEASACGIPIVATRAGGIPEAVVDGLNGYLVEPSDVHGFADRLDMLLSDPDLRQRMAVAGRDYVCRYFDLSLQSRALEDLYLRVSSS
jgi:glycosyltransferase involved in cell wall biosynthesis